MPIHLRAEQGDYAESVLLPGDPARTQYIAETFLETPRLVNVTRGLVGYTGLYDGKPVSIQTTGIGCPSAAIVAEELAMLGARRFLRVGTCGAIATGLALGDLVCAVSAVPADGTTLTYTGGDPHAPTADFDLVHAAVHTAKHNGLRLRVGSVASSGTFYEPDAGQLERWRSRGVLAVEMEAAVLFTIGALRGVAAGCLLAVSDTVIGERTRISDGGLRDAIDQLVPLALRTVLAEPKASA
jgi:DeoD family purine-nucleoside phosphorylase